MGEDIAGMIGTASFDPQQFMVDKNQTQLSAQIKDQANYNEPERNNSQQKEDDIERLNHLISMQNRERHNSSRESGNCKE